MWKMKERRNKGKRKERRKNERGGKGKSMKKREILWTVGVRLEVDRNV